MGRNIGVYFSLRWKLAILFGSVFLILQSVFAYLAYMNAQDNFENDRKEIQYSHFNIAQTLTKDSFLVLEQFAELVTLVKDPSVSEPVGQQLAITSLDENWSRWQLVWDVENIAFFDKQGVLTKSWGKSLSSADDTVKLVLASEASAHQVSCPGNCFQEAVVPVMGKSEVVGALRVARSFADVIIKYKEATNSDIGILIADQQIKAASTADKRWQYNLSGMTHPDKNVPIFEFISRQYKAEEFFGKSKRIEFDRAIYEVSIVSIQKAGRMGGPPFFLFVDDITAAVDKLNGDVKRIWLYGLLGLLLSLLVILLTMHFSFRRISRLSKALPLLSKYHFKEFRELVDLSSIAVLGFDELDTLSLTALTLSDQLEFLEQEMRGNTFDLLEKSQELAKERDFIKQLVELAPIIVIIQQPNGIILTVNHACVEAFEAESKTLVGKVFDLYLPDSDSDHFKKLNRLRTSESGDEVQIDGLLVTEKGRLRDISWFHKLLPLKQYGDETIVLTLGLDISERKMAEARNIRMAYYDYLTGLSNRRKFQEEFTQKLASAGRYGYQLALFYLDLDRFKEINDTSGHEAGDSFLKVVANALRETVRSTDLLCRLGGDEFTLLMPHADLTGIEQIAKKINHVFKALVFDYVGKSYTASASIGIAVYPLHGKTMNELMANADLAMYRAKELGRGQHHMFDPNYDYRNKLNQTVLWRSILEDAIASDKFVLFYQPILDIKVNQISHFECLVRLQQDDGKMVMPSDFVFRAEELGLIGSIDRIVLKKAVQQHVEFNRQGQDYKLSVNVSKRTFDEPAFFDFLEELFNDKEVDQERIIFEITDTTSIANYQSTNQLIDKIKSVGCVLALNDFGVEYPSLHYLKNAPVDYVKIDGSLIRQIDKNNDDKIFVKALIELAQAFGKKTVAEYVENEEILDILKKFGIDYAQGYHIGRPKTLE